MLEKPFDHYLPFQVIDFVLDEEFQEWVLRPTPETEAYWQAFRVAFPTKQTDLDDARLALQHLRADEVPVPAFQVHRSFRRVEERLDAPPAVRPLHRRAAFWRAVAACGGLLLSLYGTYRYGWAEQEYRTAFGQQQTIRLPDGTEVTLAAHSRLRVPGRWAFQTDREAYLTGEAYFAVRKQAGADGYRRFVVHTPQLDVEVLGTRFNVNTHRGKTAVLLDEGRVRLLDRRNPERSVVMRPGQEAVLASQQRAIRVETQPDKAPTAWKDNQLIFQDAPLDELSRRIEEVYGLTLVFEGPGWEGVEYTGVLPARDSTLTTRILSATFDTEPLRESNRLVFRHPD